ncbi:hypothetical protein NUACC21_41630 [Scytonema sp. NUACC21]
MKTRKLEVRYTNEFGTRPEKSQKLAFSILHFFLATKGSASILPAFAAFFLPSFIGAESIFSSTAIASLPGNSQTQTLPQEDTKIQAQGDLGDKEDKENKEDKVDLGDKENKEDKEATSTLSTPSPSLPPSSTPSSPSLPLSSPPAEQTAQTQEIPPTENNTVKTPAEVIGNKIKIEIVPVGDPRVQADGRSTIRFTGQITDENGQIIREDIVVTLTSSAGKFVGADQDKDQGGFQVIARGGEFTATLQSDIKPQQVRVRAAVDSIRTQNPFQSERDILRESPIFGERGTLNEIPFPQQTDTSIVQNFKDIPIEAYTQVEFTTYLRPSLATGIVNLRIGARGTDYWGSFREFVPENLDEGTEFDLDAAVFATGKVGNWLFTGAYNSDRPLNQDCEGNVRLFGKPEQFCEQQYPVYGDSSTVTSTAPSIDSLYLRFERSSSVIGADPDYFMWGDYNTEEFSRPSQLYTATSRQLHGFKGNYSFGPVQITGLYANNIEGYARDIIVPDGTSGEYFLSRRLVIPGSENVYLEEEEINRPGTVLDRKQLFRGRDYEIDYNRGTIKLYKSILSISQQTFGATLVRRLVISYQPEGGEETTLLGGRVQFNVSQDLENKTFLAGSYLREYQDGRDFELYGADFLLSLGNGSQIIGEFARSSGSLLNGDEDTGNAYRLEAIGNLGDRLQARAYYRSTDEGFSNNATFSYTAGQTRYGGSLLARVTDTTFLTAAYDYEENFGQSLGATPFFDVFNPEPPPVSAGSRVNNELETIRAGILQKFNFINRLADLSLEYVNRSRDDRVGDQFEGDASQLVSRLKLPLTQSLTFQAQNELNLGDSDPLYPNRTTLALDWKAYPGVTFRLAHQFYDDSSVLRGNAITSLDTIVEHKFSDDTTLTGQYSVLSGFNGLQGQGIVGVNHGARIAPGLKLSVGYQYVFKSIFNNTGAGGIFQTSVVGSNTASLGLFAGSVYSIGLDYTDNPNFKAGAKFEYRDGNEDDNLVITAAAAGKISPALTGLVRFQQAGGANIPLYLPSTGSGFVGRVDDLGDAINLRVGLAYRDPRSDKFNGLFKYEWRQNYGSIPEFNTDRNGNAHVLSGEGIYAPNWRWEFYGKYAFRLATSGDLPGNESNDSNTHLAQLRATYRTGYRTDLAVEGRWIGQDFDSGTNYNQFGVAVEGGYYLTPDLRLGVGYSFGSVDYDRDFNGYRSEGGFYVNISLKLNELLGGFGLQKPVPRQQRESEIPTAQRAPGNQSKTPQNKLIERLRQVQALANPENIESGKPKINLINTLRKLSAFRRFGGGQEE